MNNDNSGILGLDFGTKKVGVALSHGFVAEAVGSIKYLENKEKFFDEIKKIIDEQKIGKVIIGLPLREGGESDQSNWTRRQAAELEKQISAEVEFVDESYSSAQAVNNLSKKGDIDSESAKIILEQYLDTKGKSYEA